MGVTQDLSGPGVPATLGLGLTAISGIGSEFRAIPAASAPARNSSSASPTIEQPANIGFGIANNSLMGGDLLLAADFMYKFWDDSEFWQDIYDDQAVFSVGAQLARGPWRYRLGYGYADDPTDTGATGPVGNLTQIYSNVGVIPLNQPVVQYLQATQAGVIYKHRVSAGIGYKGFLAPPIDLDAHLGWQFQEDRDYGEGSLPGGGHTNAEVYSWHVGFALTWNF